MSRRHHLFIRALRTRAYLIFSVDIATRLKEKRNNVDAVVQCSFDQRSNANLQRKKIFFEIFRIRLKNFIISVDAYIQKYEELVFGRLRSIS